MIFLSEIIVFFGTLIFLFTTVKKDYHPNSCSAPLLAWFVITYLNFFFVQILLAIGHFFKRTTFWIWIFTAIYIPIILVFNMVGNVWIRGEDLDKANCVSLLSLISY